MENYFRMLLARVVLLLVVCFYLFPGYYVVHTWMCHDYAQISPEKKLEVFFVSLIAGITVNVVGCFFFFWIAPIVSIAAFIWYHYTEQGNFACITSEEVMLLYVMIFICVVAPFLPQKKSNK